MDKLRFATVDAKKLGYFAGPLGLQEGLFPAFVIHDAVTDETHPLDQTKPLTIDAIRDLVQNFVSVKFRQNPGIITTDVLEVPKVLCSSCGLARRRWVWLIYLQTRFHDEI